LPPRRTIIGAACGRQDRDQARDGEGPPPAVRLSRVRRGRPCATGSRCQRRTTSVVRRPSPSARWPLA